MLVALLDTALALALAAVCATCAMVLVGLRAGGAAGTSPFAPVRAWELEGAGRGRAEEIVAAARAAAARGGEAARVELEEREGKLWIVACFRREPVDPGFFRAITESGQWSGTVETGAYWTFELERWLEDPGRAVAWLRRSWGLVLAATPIAFLACGLYLRRKRPVAGWERAVGPAGKRALVGCALGIAGAGLATSLERGLGVLGVPQPEQAWLLRLAETDGGSLLLVVLAVLLAPLGEELFFRGHLFRHLHARASRRTAYVVSTLVFAGVHLHLALLPSYLLLGALLAWSYERWRSLLVPWTAHAAVNAIGIGMLLAG